MHPSKGGANPTEPGAATAATLLPGNDPNFVDGPFETHWDRPGNRRDGPYLGADARGRLATAPGPLETQLSGPANPGVDFSTNLNDNLYQHEQRGLGRDG